MGAHLSTIQGALQEQFKKHDQGSKGYLVSKNVKQPVTLGIRCHSRAALIAQAMLQTLKEVMAVRTLYGINPCHVGVLYQVDR